jgi:predicted acyltransferase (DUF342 family)
MTFDRQTLVIPDETKFEEHKIFANGDVIIGDRCLIQFGIKTDGRIFVGEHVIIDGDLEATKDIRIDIFSRIGGSVYSGGNVYLGEKVKIEDKLSLKGDLDVADSVDVEKGFEAKGWINIRSPIPVIIYIFIYLTQLLKMGHSEEIERLLEEMEENDGGTIPISEIFLFIPNNSIVGVQKSRVESNLRVGKKSCLIGNYDVKGKVVIGDDSVIHGSLKSSEDVFCGKNVSIKGNIKTNGDVQIEEKSHVAGDISSRKIYLSKIASVEGMLYAKNGISFIMPIEYETEKKIRRFDSNVDIVDEVDKMLE